LKSGANRTLRSAATEVASFSDFLHHSRLEAVAFSLTPIFTGRCQPAVTPTNLSSPAKALPALFHAGPRRLRSPLPSAQHFRRNGRTVPDVCSFAGPAEALPESPCEASVKRHRWFERRQLRILLSKPQRSPNATLADISDDAPYGSSSETSAANRHSHESPCGIPIRRVSATGCASQNPLAKLLRPPARDRHPTRIPLSEISGKHLSAQPAARNLSSRRCCQDTRYAGDTPTGFPFRRLRPERPPL